MVLPERVVVSGVTEAHRSLMAALEASATLAVDASGLRQADVSLVQLLVSASRTAEAAGGRLTVTGLPDAVRTLFNRAGLDVHPRSGLVSPF